MTNEEFSEEVRNEIIRSIHSDRLRGAKLAAKAAWQEWNDLMTAQKIARETAWNRAVQTQDHAEEEQRLFDQPF